MDLLHEVGLELQASRNWQIENRCGPDGEDAILKHLQLIVGSLSKRHEVVSCLREVVSYLPRTKAIG